MSQYWSKLTQSLDPYVPGEQPKDQRYIKLNTNESPFPPSPLALQAMQKQIGGDLRLYPDPNGSVLKEALARHYGLTSQHVFVGNGSDEVLAHAFCALLKHDLPLLFPDISYSFYPVYAKLYEIETRKIPLRDNFELHLADYVQPNGGIIFPNPNAPTSRAVPVADIEALLQHNTESVVVVDEAYVDFGAESACYLIERYPNLLVVQTFSKSRSLAGLRVGMAMGHPALIEALERVKNSFNSYPLDRVALAGAAATLGDGEYFQACRDQIMAIRCLLTEQLIEIGFDVLPSDANFVFARPPNGNAEALYLALKQRGILVRYFNKPRINEYLRITVGTEEEIQTFLRVVRELLV